MAKSDSNEPVNFEKELARLEEIVAKLEAGALGLDESIALYEEGVKRLRGCQERLAQAEAKIKLLVDGATGPETRDFDPAAAEKPVPEPEEKEEGKAAKGGAGAEGEEVSRGKSRRRSREPRGRGLF